MITSVSAESPFRSFPKLSECLRGHVRLPKALPFLVGSQYMLAPGKEEPLSSVRNPVSVRVIRCQFAFSGVIRCRFIFSGKNDELTPDF